MVALVVVFTVGVMLALRGLGIMVLWNWLLPSILGLPEISFFQSMGLYLLVTFLAGALVDKGMVPKKEKK